MSAQAENLASPRTNTGLLAEDNLVRFDFLGKTILGDEVEYYIYATDEDEARKQLSDARIAVEAVALHTARRRRKRKFTREDLGTFSIQLAERVSAGDSVAAAVLDIGRAARNNLLREALTDVAVELRREGAKPADAFRLRQDVFPRAFANVIQIGARKGDISDMLLKYGVSQLRTADNIARFKSALYYPITIISLASVIVGAMCYLILPRMEELYTSLLPTTGGQLPWMTRSLLGFSRFMGSVPGILSVIAITALMVYIIRWAKTDGRETMERKSIYWPGIGGLIRSIHAAYTVHLMSILVGAGVTPNEFLREAADASMNVVYRERLEAIRQSFHEGGLELQTAFAPYAFLFGDGFQAAVATGEKTGRLDRQLANYAEMIDRRAQETITRLSKLIEPLTLIIAGVVIGLIVVAAYLPLFTLVGELANMKR